MMSHVAQEFCEFKPKAASGADVTIKKYLNNIIGPKQYSFKYKLHAPF